MSNTRKTSRKPAQLPGWMINEIQAQTDITNPDGSPLTGEQIETILEAAARYRALMTSIDAAIDDLNRSEQ